MTEPRFDTPSQQQAADSSLGQLVGEVTRDLSTLMRKEIELAKAELTESAKKAGTGAGMFAGAAYGAMMTILFLSIALWWALGTLVGNGWSGVIVAVLWAIIAAILFAVGRSQVAKVKGAPQTVETIKEIPETLKRNEENR
ncbi:phage holin family protein [Microbacterium sp. NPDC057407]|uniref:phage holin family protein n=1 Tax=Microbacterium sp. NPDC057407 TaxID=3346120 RepID=UPI00367098F8